MFYEDTMKHWVIKYLPTGQFLEEGFGIMFVVSSHSEHVPHFTVDEAHKKINLLSHPHRFQITNIYDI